MENLTAILSARQQKAGFNIWKEGLRSEELLSVMVSEQSHYSIKRALSVMGLGDESYIPVPAKEDFSMDTRCLEEVYKKAIAQSQKVSAILANTCSIATGSYDNLKEVASFCPKNHGMYQTLYGLKIVCKYLEVRRSLVLTLIKWWD